MDRCKWCNSNNPLYLKYHDEEWGALHLDDEHYLFEMLILESFQAGLSWECVLNKREDFSKAFSDFDAEKIMNFKNGDVVRLLNDKKIVRNKSKIQAAIINARIFTDIQKEFGSFKNYLLSFCKDIPIYETGKIKNDLSDEISKNLKKRKMKFMGSVAVYSYLQAIGIINSHEKECYLYKGENI